MLTLGGSHTWEANSVGSTFKVSLFPAFCTNRSTGSDRDLEWYTWHLWRRLMEADLGSTAKLEVGSGGSLCVQTPAKGVTTLTRAALVPHGELKIPASVGLSALYQQLTVDWLSGQLHWFC